MYYYDDIHPNFSCHCGQALILWFLSTLPAFSVEEIQRDGYAPTAIVGVARGGWVASRTVADGLGKDNLTSAKVDHYEGTSKKDEPVVVFESRRQAVKDENVLVVDDIVDTGKSMRTVNQHIQQQGAYTVRNATVHQLPTSELETEYTGYDLDDFVWIIYPWNITEDVKEILENACPGSEWLSFTQVDEMLNRYHNIGISDINSTLSVTFADITETIERDPKSNLETRDKEIRLV